MSKLNRPKQFDASREEFVTAALDVFNRKGFHAASVDDIVTRAGRSKGGFYHHFASKDQLYIEVFEASLRATVERLEAGMNSGTTVRETLDNLISKFEPSMTDRSKMSGAIEFILQSIRNECAANTVKSIHTQTVDALAKLLTVAAQRGELREHPDFHLIAEMMVASGRGIAVTTLMCDEIHRLPDLLRLLTDTALTGLSKAQ